MRAILADIDLVREAGIGRSVDVTCEDQGVIAGLSSMSQSAQLDKPASPEKMHATQEAAARLLDELPKPAGAMA